jgi:hypothetical protein
VAKKDEADAARKRDEEVGYQISHSDRIDYIDRIDMMYCVQNLDGYDEANNKGLVAFGLSPRPVYGLLIQTHTLVLYGALQRRRKVAAEEAERRMQQEQDDDKKVGNPQNQAT